MYAYIYIKTQMLPLPSQAPKELCKHLADAYKCADKYHDCIFRVSYTEKPAEKCDSPEERQAEENFKPCSWSCVLIHTLS